MRNIFVVISYNAKTNNWASSYDLQFLKVNTGIDTCSRLSQT